VAPGPTTSDWRAALQCVSRSDLDEQTRERLVRGIRQQVEQSIPLQIYSFAPEGPGWRLGHAGETRICMPSRGLWGLEVAHAAFRRAAPTDEKGPDARREAVARARNWVWTVTKCEPLVDAMASIKFSKSGVWYEDQGLIRIDWQ
jgi:hypothetical protein